MSRSQAGTAGERGQAHFAPKTPQIALDPDHDLPLFERIATGTTAVEIFERFAKLPHAVFFDSASREAGLGRYSFVAADPFEWISLGSEGGAPLAAAQAARRKYRALPCPGLPPFPGGVAGLFGYELARSLERIPAAKIDDFPMPAMAVGLYDVVVAFDHESDEAWIISQGFPEVEPTARRARAWERLLQAKSWISGRVQTVTEDAAVGTSVADLAPQFDVGVEGVTSNFSQDAYRRMVARAVEYIHAGDIFQVNLAQRLLAPARTNSVDLYLRLRERNPAPYAGYFDLGEWQVCSTSPECFLTVRDGMVETRPIKGTRGRVGSPVADLFVGDELQASEKDRAENVMIVDLLRNDLSRVCVPESVHVAQLCGVETYAFVKHLVSIVRGRLIQGKCPFDLLQACFPGGSITGAPKIRAMEIIAELEPTCRGAYCGSLAYIGFDGQMDSSILIRSVIAGHGWWQLAVGGGIVAQSQPDDEYRETWHKARGLLEVLTP